MWHSLPFAARPIESHGLLEHVRPLDDLPVDGGADLPRLWVPENDTSDRYTPRTRPREIGFPAHLLASPALNDAIPGLNARDPPGAGRD